ncbi:cell envelope integrity protein TolA [Zobellia galactanivorans]|uniref:cell envelope integrity protein TolA n=1 Tax=Zobellia galactanivorans (strain DSM 12802 / CCUG 47099 / CIP 106680 / NCIMB 13871 / Dsij) TaxID=63186 RepID=UPI001C06636F|nr:DUF4175 family protein [Zobellia galactanivorans]MBU3026709.1 hypothetical protein [Zobellia galactanivorans]
MNAYQNILHKLNAFVRKYYTKMLVKGILLFIALGLLFFFVVLGIEYMLWLNSTGRLLLLLGCISVELLLLFKYILTPLFYLFRLKRGMDKKEASVLIGKHFPEVGDKLYNLIELGEDKDRSELLLASIEQRSQQMGVVPFTKAVDFRENLKYLKYLGIPLLVILIMWLTGNLRPFFGSADRVVNYNMAYEPPAPFSFHLLSNDLSVLDTESLTIEVMTKGEVRPEMVYIEIDGKQSVLQEFGGRYQYTFDAPVGDMSFAFTANGVRSREYTLKVLRTPTVQDFEVNLQYPSYLNMPPETLKSTGNATFPEGTRVTWKVIGKNTESIRLLTKDTVQDFTMSKQFFTLSKSIYRDLAYEITTSNSNVSDYERLGYKFKVIRDAYPTIKVQQIRDSLNPNVAYYVGEASDDYRLSKVRLVCYSTSQPEDRQSIAISTPETNFDQFYYTFPSGLDLKPGVDYSFYFEATDNDAIHKGKSSKSQVFSLALLDEAQLKNKELESQQTIINNLDKSLNKFKEQKTELKELNENQKEKNQLNFNDKNQIKDFLRKQQLQENQMQKFSKQLKENLNKGDKDDKLNQLLQERLERQEMEAKKNEKLLEELNKVADKIDKQSLAKKLEELGKKQQNSERNLEQLLELTKRYYVTEKADQLGRELEKLAEEQEKEAQKKAEAKSLEEQEKLNQKFSELGKELEELEKDNQDLKKPMSIEMDQQKKEAVEKDQEEAKDALEKLEKERQSGEPKESGEKATKKQKSAAQKMKEMSEALSKAAAGGGGSSITEDAEMLRQILDNLVTFSFKQERLYENLEEVDANTSQFSNSIRKQQELRDLFEHVDDSLFALSLRRAELSEFVNEQITEVYYNIDKTLESVAENQIYQGVSYQKYVLTASNSLADFLARILDNMQESMMSGKGQGEGEEFQLPDIIKGQQELKEKMEGMGKEGQGKPSEGQGQGQKGKGQGQQGEGKEGEGQKKGEGQGGDQGDPKGKGQGKNGEGENGGKSGANGGQGSGNSNQVSEEELKEIYEIYKTQQMLREKLEQQLKDMMNSGDRKLGQKLVKQMEDFENDLLENGVTQRSLSKINNIQYEMLKLENATLKQGKKSERESNTNTNQFKNPITSKPSVLENYRDEIEILNRQALPLRHNFQNKVKEYFKSND